MYKLNYDSKCITREDGACIPADPANIDYAEYLIWISEGNTPTPADIPPVPKLICSPRQIRQALTLAGLRDGVEAGILAGDADLKDWWAYATSFEEDHPMVIAMATALGVPDIALHELFVTAVSL